MTKTLLVGNFGAGNLGDEMILLSALEDYEDVIVMTSDAEFSQHFTGKKFKTIHMPPAGVRSTIVAGLKKFKESDEDKHTLYIIKTEVDQVVFPGGGLFAIIPQAYVVWFFVLTWCRKMMGPDRPIKMEHQGVDELPDQATQLVLKKALKIPDSISVRDEASKQVVEKYSLHKASVDEDRVDLWLQKHYKKVEPSESGLVVVSSLKMFDVTKVINKFEGKKLIFLAMSEKDIKYLKKMGIEDYVFPKTVDELIKVFETAEYVVGERFHTLLLGHHFCDPDKVFTLRKPYSKKVESLCAKKGIEVL